jgi:predicted aspartyl protease
MPFHSGFIDPKGQPRLRLLVVGQQGDGELEPIVDTGFTGFLAMPAREAHRLGILAHSRLNCLLADGRINSMPIGVGSIELSGSELYRGTVLLSDAADSLLGMEFLRQSHKGLYVDRKTVVLMDETDIEQLRKLRTAD